MAIYQDDKKIIPFKGDYEPLAIYDGEKVIFEPLETEKQGTTLDFENTYNDAVRGLTVSGKSVQDKHRIGVKQDSIVQFEDGKIDGEALVEIKANENLLPFGSVSKPFNFAILTWSGYSTKQKITDYPNSPYKKIIKLYINAGDERGGIYWRGYDPSNLVSMMIRGNAFIRGVQLTSDWSVESWVDINKNFPFLGNENEERWVEIMWIKMEKADLNNGIPLPSPWIPHVDDGLPMPSAEVTRCGRNLFNNSIVTDRRGNANGVSTLPGGGNKFVSPANITFYYHYLKFIPCKNKNIVFTASDDFSENRNTRIGQSYNIEYANGDSGYNPAGTPFYCTNNVSITKPRFDPVEGNNYPLQVNQQMLELGSTAHPYEPYQGDTYTILYNTPTKIPLLNGVNTFFADEDVQLDIRYEKSESTTPLETDITVPTPDFPLAINSVDGEITSAGRTDVEKSLCAMPILRSVGDVHDEWHEDGSWTQWIDGDFDETKPLESQTNLILLEPIHHPAPTDFKPLKTYPHVTTISTDSEIQPQMEGAVKTWQ